MREVMSPAVARDRYQLGDPLIQINPKDLPATTRTISPFATATLGLVASASSKNRFFVWESRGQKLKQDTRTVAGSIATWQFLYDAYQISNDGQGRKEYADLAKFAAIGQGDETGAVAGLLSEGNKQVEKKK